MRENREPNTQYDVAILGAGPAGLAAAIWCLDLGLSAVVFETAERPGGQLNRIHAPIRNYPGIADVEPQNLISQLADQARKAGAELRLSQEVPQVAIGKKTITIEHGRTIGSRGLIVATGVRRRELGVPGEQRLIRKGILESGVKDHMLAAGKIAGIIGGGDAAFENALILAKVAKKVFLIHRGSAFTARREFVEMVLSAENIEVLTDTRVTEFLGGEDLEALNINRGGVVETIEVGAALIRIGVLPNSELIAERVDLDSRGYVVTGPHGETKTPFVYAIGDVALPISPTIASAVGMGASAAKHLEKSLRLVRSRSDDEPRRA